MFLKLGKQIVNILKMCMCVLMAQVLILSIKHLLNLVNIDNFCNARCVQSTPLTGFSRCFSTSQPRCGHVKDVHMDFDRAGINLDRITDF